MRECTEVPVVILFPDRKEMIPIKSLETATEMLKI